MGLVPGDLVTVTATPDRRVELQVLVRMASESVLGSVKRVAAEDGRGAWQVFGLARQRPLVGKKVLVVGGDSFKAGYRAIVESLGAEFEFQGAGGDMTMVKSRARGADIVVLVTDYLSHKVSGVVTDTMKADGREAALCYAGSKGRGAILEALRPHFAERPEATG